MIYGEHIITRISETVRARATKFGGNTGMLRTQIKFAL